MFDQTLLDSSVSKAGRRARRLRVTLLAGLAETAALGALVVWSLLRVQALPAIWAVEGPDVFPVPPATRLRESRSRRAPRVTLEELLRAPVRIPKAIERVEDRREKPWAPPIDGVIGEVPGGGNGELDGILHGLGNVPPPPPAKPHGPARVHIGGQVEAARVIFQPKPDYPPLARMARIQGTVRLEAIISRDGTIQNLKVLSGHPLLVRAAIAAVSRWRYQPTLLNGEAVEVQTEIDVTFNLAE